MKKPVKQLVKRGNDPTGHGYYGAKRGNRKDMEGEIDKLLDNDKWK